MVISDPNKAITAEMTLLEVVHQHRSTEGVFRRYEGEAQACLLCQALFDTLAEAAAKYGLDLDRLLQDLREAAAGESHES